MILSIIIPVYNVEKYVDECIQSITDQINNNTEIIIVNDGSTDNSKAICEKYICENIKIINQNNMGLSEARNTGIKNSKGEFIMFIDSDDYIEKNSLHEFYNIIEGYKPDIIIGRGILLYENGRTKEKTKYLHFDSKLMDVQNYLEKAIRFREITMCSPMNIYKRDLIIENNLFFEKGILHEDELWTPLIFANATKIYYHANLFYYHRQRIGSITKSKTKERNVSSLLYVIYKLKEELYMHDKNIRTLLYDRIAELYLSTYYISKSNKFEYKFSGQFLKGMGLFSRTKIKITLFTISQKMYYTLNRTIKKISGGYK